MRRQDFSFELPPELIAQSPLPRRSGSRLLVLDGATGRMQDRQFDHLVEFLEPGDLLVLNDTRVLPARLFGEKASGGRVELLLERITEPQRARMHIRASRSPKPGHTLRLPGGATAVVESRTGTLFDVCFDRDVEPYLMEHGQVPLPPYIDRPPSDADRERYQTLFAREAGAVAAPTAGLHFDEPLFERLEQRGVARAFVTLHVGAGTFSPVRTEQVEEHRLHAEWLSVSAELCSRVAAARARGGRVVAVGTTAVRSLETAARHAQQPGRLEPFQGETELFIYPGYEFRIVDAIVTNFHLPESSLLMLVAAFAGREHTLAAYRHAVAERYRFFSYGDAMFVTPAEPRDRGAPK